jgi:hypothetical protein
VIVGYDKDGNPKYENAAEVWLRHPQRRQFLKGFTFDPRRIGSADPEQYNRTMPVMRSGRSVAANSAT